MAKVFWGLALRRYKVQHFSAASPCVCTDEIDSRIRKRFPFLLTDDQDGAIAEIAADMSRHTPMNRLLQGDVGSGKTVVALYAALLAVANRTQVAIMAPTEILAGQHFLSIERYLKNSKVKRVLVTGGLTGKKRAELLEQIKSGEIDIVVGTVALLQADIEFQKLGLVIIDEQHKFGVEQRGELRKQTTPHCLVMTATPIPRTLAMTAFGDLDVSVIKQSLSANVSRQRSRRILFIRGLLPLSRTTMSGLQLMNGSIFLRKFFRNLPLSFCTDRCPRSRNNKLCRSFAKVKSVCWCQPL